MDPQDQISLQRLAMSLKVGAVHCLSKDDRTTLAELLLVHIAIHEKTRDQFMRLRSQQFDAGAYPKMDPDFKPADLPGLKQLAYHLRDGTLRFIHEETASNSLTAFLREMERLEFYLVQYSTPSP